MPVGEGEGGGEGNAGVCTIMGTTWLDLFVSGSGVTKAGRCFSMSDKDGEDWQMQDSGQKIASSA